MSTILVHSSTTVQTDKVTAEDSSTASSESSASPLSKTNDNHIFKFDTPSIQKHEINKEIDECRQKLQSLNTLLSPMQLFSNFDLIIRNYHRLKKEYIKRWKLQQSYRQKLRSMLKQHKSSTSLSDIALFIQTLQSIQFSVMELFQNCHQLKLANISHTNVPKKSDVKQASGPGLFELSKKRNTNTTNNVRESVETQMNNDNDENPIIPVTESIQSYRRRSSVRSFGTLYSDQFRNSVAENYKKSMTVKGELKCDDEIANKLEVVEYYHNNYIGQNEVFESPFGVRPVIYCDWTASGKPLQCVENYINNEMLPLYANTHTNTSITGTQTSKFRSESRSIILESIGGDQQHDVVIFTGSGTTAAIYKLSRVLMKSKGLYKPFRTVVFISVYEHNSNIFIWKELGCKVIVIPEDKDIEKGGLDLKILEKHLKYYTSRRMKIKYHLLIGSFSAASNVSGIIAPVDETTLLLHEYNALACWDYATGGPYMHVEMSNNENPMLSKDAVFLSPHKYLGGPGCCGILCAKKRLFSNYTPVVPGGGTVFVAYGVKEGEWEYLDNIEEREEGGTPDIIGSIKASFVFMVKDHLSIRFIQDRENEYLQYFLNQCEHINNLVIMGNTKCHRLPIFSFLINHSISIPPNNQQITKYLHYNFIAALMNDLFGIQGRGGCACAGMYGKYVLNINKEQISDVVNQLRDNKNELARPGYFRINLHYTLSKDELKYIINAIQFICKNGWLFLPLYDVDMETGNYFHREFKHKQELKSLLDLSFSRNGIKIKHKKQMYNGDNYNINKYLDFAQNNIINNLKQYLPSTSDEFKNEKKIHHKTAWYWLPSELYKYVINFVQ